MDKSCCEKIRIYCLKGEVQPLPTPVVVLAHDDLYRLWFESKTTMPFPDFEAHVRTEADRQLAGSWGIISAAQGQLDVLPPSDEVALASFRICFRIGRIRICIEVLL
jgi:hypothetical protein